MAETGSASTSGVSSSRSTTSTSIKIAPFNRYQTLDDVAQSWMSRERDIALYTGNDDMIVYDLLSEYRLNGRTVHFAGGLLGQWAVGTQKAARLLDDVKVAQGTRVPLEAMALAGDVTDANAAIFDAANGFAGCIAGIHEILRRQGSWPAGGASTRRRTSPRPATRDRPRLRGLPARARRRLRRRAPRRMAQVSQANSTSTAGASGTTASVSSACIRVAARSASRGRSCRGRWAPTERPSA